MTDNKYNEKTFCLAPWNYLLVSPQGELYTCYEAKGPMGNLYDHTFEEIWESEIFTKLREEFLSGKSPEQCEKCQIKEQALPGESLRCIVNKFLGGIETLKDVNQANPRILDISFSNLCNLKCRMCSSYYSSAIEQEESLGKNNKKTVNEDNLWDFILLTSKKVQKITLAGGEPLMHPKHELFLDNLIAAGKTNTIIQYNTNGTIISQKILDLWKNFSQISLIVSIDGMGDHAKILRHGSDFSRIEKNLIQIRTELPELQVKSYSTLSVLNIYHYLDYLTYVIDHKYFSLAEIQMHYLVTPPHYSIQILPQKEKEKITQLYFRFIKEYLLTNFDLSEAKNLILQIKMILNYMNFQDQSNLIDDFLKETQRLDTLRGEDLSSVDSNLKKLTTREEA